MKLLARVLMPIFVFFGYSAWASDPMTQTDNAAINARDRGGKTVTAQDQVKGSMSDVEITRMARQKLIRDPELSTNGKNVKIITLEKVITLRGPVASQAEKMRILDHVRSVSSNAQIIDNLEVRR